MRIAPVSTERLVATVDHDAVAVRIKAQTAMPRALSKQERYAQLEAREADAITAFLRNHWTFSLDDALLHQLILGLLRMGTARGEALLVEKLGVQVSMQKREVEAVNKVLGKKRFRAITLPNAALPVSDFEVASAHAMKWVHETFGRIKPRPKGYALHQKTANEYDRQTPESGDYKGTRLHFTLGASNYSLGENLSRVGVYYGDVRGRAPLVTLVETVLRQGMNVPLAADFDAIKQRLKRQQEQLAAALPRTPTEMRLDRLPPDVAARLRAVLGPTP